MRIRNSGKLPKGEGWELVTIITVDGRDWKLHRKFENEPWAAYKIGLVGSVKGRANFRLAFNARTHYLAKSRDHLYLINEKPELYQKLQEVLANEEKA